ncbi:hypothetical protein GG344DRAFT_90019 [Lentinula edodes]|nr:hypothetical protein GG344DRAFT_90019 [Lentinula edodes]
MSPSRSQLLKIATSLVPTYGFTRETLSRSVLELPKDRAHSEPLSENAVSSLFGSGDYAKKTLIEAWLSEGITQMASAPSPSLGHVLHARLSYNEPVLHYLPEAFALLASPEGGLPPLDPRPALKHASRIADEASYISGDASTQLSWYTRRASLAAIYSAAELHQFTSPRTAHAFLDSLLTGSSALKQSVDEVQLFSSYVLQSWKGILQSKGILHCWETLLASICIGFQSNFSCSHSVVLPHSISEVFTTIGTTQGHERVCRLSKLCTNFELLNSDTVSLPTKAALSDSHVRALPTSDSRMAEAQNASEDTRTLPRQAFTMTETIPLVFGLFKNDVILNGTLTWDESAKLALYETESNNGVQVWKLRTFEEVDANSTRVSERIEGVCPRWLRAIVQREASKGHITVCERKRS